MLLRAWSGKSIRGTNSSQKRHECSKTVSSTSTKLSTKVLAAGEEPFILRHFKSLFCLRGLNGAASGSDRRAYRCRGLLGRNHSPHIKGHKSGEEHPVEEPMESAESSGIVSDQ